MAQGRLKPGLHTAETPGSGTIKVKIRAKIKTGFGSSRMCVVSERTDCEQDHDYEENAYS
jgi:hypothetical protein